MALWWFTAANALLACLSGFGYLSTARLVPFSPGWTFAAAAICGEVAAAFLLAGGLLSLLSRVAPRRLLLVLAAVVFTGLHVFLMIDKAIFTLFRFHWNGLVWNVLTTPGGWESMHLEGKDLITIILTIIAILVIQGVVFYWLSKRKGAAKPAGRRWAVVWALTLAVITIEHLAFAYADLFNIRSVTRAAKVVPFYQPLTIKKLARKRGWVEIDREAELTVESAAGGFLNYPLAPITGAPPAKFPNIVWVVLDGFRYDALNSDVTPNIAAFARRSQVFTDHWSGGNATRFGIFSMFYGLYGTYWPSFLGERRGPVLIDRLKELGYRFKILSSTSLTFPEFRKTAFVQIPESIDDALPGAGADARDAAMIDRAKDFFKGLKSGERSFTLVFTDSTHAGYYFPKEFAKYKPYPETLEYLKLGANTDPRQPHNRYLNAVHYNDHLIGLLLKDLEASGRLKDTIVLITGDHGEEFYEHGAWGHNGNFSREETLVPVVLYMPGKAPKRWSHRTSHHDLAPTFMGLLGAKNPPSDYSLGRDLFSAGGRPYAVCSDWDEFAMITDKATFVFPAESHGGMGGIEVLDTDYKEAPNRKELFDRHAADMSNLLAEMTAFLRK